MENIGMYLEATDTYGLPKSDSFQTVDLYEAQNMPQVSITFKGHVRIDVFLSQNTYSRMFFNIALPKAKALAKVAYNDLAEVAYNSLAEVTYNSLD